MNFKDFYKSLRKNKNITKITLICAAIVLILLTGVICTVNACISEMQRIEEANKAEEERQQIADEEEQRRLEEQTRQWAISKENEVACNLKPLGLPYKRLNVPIIYQYPEYPSACECLALTNMLNYYGFNLSKGELVENYLIYDDDDWVHYYVGSPYVSDRGGIMMCPGIKILFDKFIGANPAPYKGFDITGRNFEDLFAYIERGHPVQIWSSLNMNDLGDPTSTSGDYKVYWYSHSILLTGFDRENGIVYIADSINGDAYYSINKVRKIFEKQNSQAFVMISQEELDKWIYDQDWSYDDTIPKDSYENSDEEESDED